MMRYSDINAIDIAVHCYIECMRVNPFSAAAKVELGVMTLSDIIEEIRLHYGDDAARSIRITVH